AGARPGSARGPRGVQPRRAALFGLSHARADLQLPGPRPRRLGAGGPAHAAQAGERDHRRRRGRDRHLPGPDRRRPPLVGMAASQALNDWYLSCWPLIETSTISPPRGSTKMLVLGSKVAFFSALSCSTVTPRLAPAVNVPALTDATSSALRSTSSSAKLWP